MVTNKGDNDPKHFHKEKIPASETMPTQKHVRKYNKNVLQILKKQNKTKNYSRKQIH